MGGAVIILSAVLGYFLAHLLTTRDRPPRPALLLLFLFVGLGVVGFLDDYIKIAKQRSLGLRSRAKMAGQVARRDRVRRAGAAVPRRARPDPGVDRHLVHPRHRERWTLPTVLVVLLILLMIAGDLERGEPHRRPRRPGHRRLDDGVRRLHADEHLAEQPVLRSSRPGHTCYEVRDPLDLAVVAAALTGACFGFLWWNASPAKIFMGDTGSLALGGALAGLAILTRTELLLVVLGGLFVLSTLSVILQVGFFKVTGGKRVFRMAPLHHHFELKGWDEITIVIRFWIIAGLCVAAGLGIFYAEWVAGA